MKGKLQMSLRSKVADWITIVTGPLTVLMTFAAWTGRLDTLRAGGASETTQQALAVIAITIFGSFLFVAQLRLVISYSQRYGQKVVVLLAVLIGILGLAIFWSVELLILETLVPATQWPLVQLIWLALPALLWVGADMIAIMLIWSGELGEVRSTD